GRREDLRQWLGASRPERPGEGLARAPVVHEQHLPPAAAVTLERRQPFDERRETSLLVVAGHSDGYRRGAHVSGGLVRTAAAQHGGDGLQEDLGVEKER